MISRVCDGVNFFAFYEIYTHFIYDLCAEYDRRVVGRNELFCTHRLTGTLPRDERIEPYIRIKEVRCWRGRC